MNTDKELVIDHIIYAVTEKKITKIEFSRTL